MRIKFNNGFRRFGRAKTTTQRVSFVAGLATASALVGGCGDSAEDTSAGESLDAALLEEVAETYANHVYLGYGDSLSRVDELSLAVDAFVAAPSDDSQERAKQAWFAARVPYGQTEGFRFYGGPIDSDDGPEGLLNAWPLDEAYIDYVAGAPESGVINRPDEFPVIDEQLIESLNEKDGETNVSAGYHAVEFLLWGQDTSLETPGQRPFTDYVDGPDGTATYPGRRGQYLVSATALLRTGLSGLEQAWRPDAVNYRQAFMAEPALERIRRMIRGAAFLSSFELAGERMQVAYETSEREDEHSCFSDNTHVDIEANATSVQNIYLGRWVDLQGVVHDGPGLDELVGSRDADLNARIQAELEASLKAVREIPAPFERAILEPDGREKVALAIQALRRQSASLVEAARVLGVEVSVEE